MIFPELTYEISRLNESVRAYALFSSKTEGEIISKQAGKLGYSIMRGLRELAPAKGAVRAERIAALQSGEGVHVRPGVYEEIRAKWGEDFASTSQKFKGAEGQLKGTGYSALRTMNFQALAVQRELNLRESARGFMAWSTPRGRSFAEVAHIEQSSRYGNVLSTFDIDVRQDSPRKFAQFSWDSRSKALEGLTQAQQMDVLTRAVGEVTDDIMVYVEDKISKDIDRANAS